MISAAHRPSAVLHNHQQRGVALIASLIILLLMTFVALSAFRGNNLFEKIAGNTREKQRAQQAAQNALLYAENWISQNKSTPATVTCAGTGHPTTLRVCSDVAATTNASTILSLAGVMYSYSYLSTVGTNVEMTSSSTTSCSNTSGGGLASSSSDVNYASYPCVYIYYTGQTLAGTSAPLYEITAIGYGGVGGTNGTVAIVQSYYVWGSGKSPYQAL